MFQNESINMNVCFSPSLISRCFRVSRASASGTKAVRIGSAIAGRRS